MGFTWADHHRSRYSDPTSSSDSAAARTRVVAFFCCCRGETDDKEQEDGAVARPEAVLLRRADHHRTLRFLVDVEHHLDPDPTSPPKTYGAVARRSTSSPLFRAKPASLRQIIVGASGFPLIPISR
nr:PREDICTED: uncharacterized protein LOC108952106 [Musa acuminata subsp. malaccensis]